MTQGIKRSAGIVGLLIVAVTAQANLIALWQRDYTNNITATNRSWYYKNPDGSAGAAGGVYPSIEWNTERSENYPVVYVKGGSATITVTFMNPQPFSSCVGDFIVNNARLRIPPVTSGGSEMTVSLSTSVSGSLNISPESTGSVTLTVSGFPSYVTRGYIQIDGKVQGGAIQYWTSGGYQDWEMTYLPDSTPDALQTVPWTDLLGYSCRWAHGETDLGDIATKVAQGLFHEGRWTYDPDDNNLWQEISSIGTAHYLLSNALSNEYNMDCRDVSGFVALSMMSLGHDTAARRSRRLASPHNFYTNLMCPMGSDKTDGLNYENYTFNFHQYAVVSNDVYDAAVAPFFRSIRGDIKGLADR